MAVTHSIPQYILYFSLSEVTGHSRYTGASNGITHDNERHTAATIMTSPAKRYSCYTPSCSSCSILVAMLYSGTVHMSHKVIFALTSVELFSGQVNWWRFEQGCPAFRSEVVSCGKCFYRVLYLGSPSVLSAKSHVLSRAWLCSTYTF